MSAGATTQAPFLLTVGLGDGTVAEIPSADLEELGWVVGRMAETCARNRRPFPPTAISDLVGGTPGPGGPGTGSSPTC